MDVVVNAAIQSPLVRTLSATKGKGDTFVHRIKDNIPPVSFGKVELSPKGGAVGTYNRNYQFEIPQYGYWRSLILKFQGSENGLGTQLIQDIYNSLSSNQRYCQFYGESAGVLYARYLKSDLFGCLRNGYGATAPNNQTFVPQGWVSPFDANVRSGNYDPWESMWLRLIGGNSYGNQAGTGTYPNPEVVAATGDARIAPFRHVPRFDALNSFGRNVHCLGDANYDPGNTTGNNKLNPAACGYNINNATPGPTLAGAITGATIVNGVPSGATLTGSSGDAILSATTTLTGVPNGATALQNTVPRGTGGTGLVSTNWWPSSTGIWTYNNTSVVSATALNNNVPQGASILASINNLLYSPAGSWTNVTGVPNGATIGGTGAGESVAFGMQTTHDGVPFGCTAISTGGQFPFSSGTWQYQNNVVRDATLSSTSGAEDIYFGQTRLVDNNRKTGVMPFLDNFVNIGGGPWGPGDNTGANWVGDALILEYTGSGGSHGGVPHDAGLSSNMLQSTNNNIQGVTGVPFGSSAGTNVFNGIPGGNGGTVNLRGGVPYSSAAVANNMGKSSTSIGNISLIPYNCSTTLLNNVPNGASFITTGGGVAIAGASPTSAQGIPYNMTGVSSGVPSGCTAFNGVAMSSTGSTARNKVPYNATLVDGVIANATLISVVGADNLRVSGELDWSFLVPFDGCMFHQVPIYTTAGDAVFYLQPDGQYAAVGTSNGGSGGWAGSTPPAANTNTQMRNRYLGQRLASTYDWCSQANLSRYLGALMAVTVTLSTHNRVLQTLYPMETMARIYRMPMDQKRRWLSMIRPHIVNSPSSIASGATETPGYSTETNTTGVTWMRTPTAAYGTRRTWVCYFPCFFSFFEEPSMNLDTRFIENLTVDVLVNPMQNIYDPSDLGPASTRLGTTFNFNDTTQDDRGVMTTYTGFHSQEFRQRVSVINTALTVTALAYYHNFHDSTSQSIRDYNYRPDVPGNILGYNTYSEPPVLVPALALTTGSSVNINLSCSNLTTEIIFCVRRRQKDVVAHPQLASFPFESFMTTLPIAAVTLTASGQLLYAATGVECMLADQWDFNMSNVKTGQGTTNDSSLYADSHESYYAQSKPTCDGFFAYRIPFSFSTDRTYNSGCLALQTLNNPVLSIQLLPMHGWVINDDNLAFRMGSLLNLSENMNQRECDTQTIFDNDFQVEIYENYFQLVRIDSNTGSISKSIDL